MTKLDEETLMAYVDGQLDRQRAAEVEALLVEDAEARAKAVSAAKVQIGKACKFVGQNAIQLHGGMGMTDEMAIGHYFKRATMIESQFGNTDHHLARYEGLSFKTAA